MWKYCKLNLWFKSSNIGKKSTHAHSPLYVRPLIYIYIFTLNLLILNLWNILKQCWKLSLQGICLAPYMLWIPFHLAFPVLQYPSWDQVCPCNSGCCCAINLFEAIIASTVLFSGFFPHIPSMMFIIVCLFLCFPTATYWLDIFMMLITITFFPSQSLPAQTPLIHIQAWDFYFFKKKKNMSNGYNFHFVALSSICYFEAYLQNCW